MVVVAQHRDIAACGDGRSARALGAFLCPPEPFDDSRVQMLGWKGCAVKKKMSDDLLQLAVSLPAKLLYV